MIITTAARICVMAFIAVTSGCGIQEKIAQFDDVRAAASTARQFARISELNGSAYAVIPNSGRATFDGPGFIDVVEVVGGRTVARLTGAARLSAQFGGTSGQGISGQIADLQRLDTNLSTVPVTGAIDITAGGIGRDGPNTVSGDYAGQFLMGGKTYRVSGTYDGRYRGTREGPIANGAAIRGVTIGDLLGRVRVDGQSAQNPLVGTLRIAAEN